MSQHSLTPRRSPDLLAWLMSSSVMSRRCVRVAGTARGWQEVRRSCQAGKGRSGSGWCVPGPGGTACKARGSHRAGSSKVSLGERTWPKASPTTLHSLPPRPDGLQPGGVTTGLLRLDEVFKGKGGGLELEAVAGKR